MERNSIDIFRVGPDKEGLDFPHAVKDTVQL